jgi:hypothetical protein
MVARRVNNCVSLYSEVLGITGALKPWDHWYGFGVRVDESDLLTILRPAPACAFDTTPSAFTRVTAAVQQPSALCSLKGLTRIWKHL